jgi:hypothetical protein
MPFNENQKKPKTEELPKSVICICMNCEDRFGSNNGVCAMFCKNCKTKEMRAALNAENARLMAEQKGSINPQTT